MTRFYGVVDNKKLSLRDNALLDEGLKIKELSRFFDALAISNHIEELDMNCAFPLFRSNIELDEIKKIFDKLPETIKKVDLSQNDFFKSIAEKDKQYSLALISELFSSLDVTELNLSKSLNIDKYADDEKYEQSSRLFCDYAIAALSGISSTVKKLVLHKNDFEIMFKDNKIKDEDYRKSIEKLFYDTFRNIEILDLSKNSFNKLTDSEKKYFVELLSKTSIEILIEEPLKSEIDIARNNKRPNIETTSLIIQEEKHIAPSVNSVVFK